MRISHFVLKDLKRYVESMVYRESFIKTDSKDETNPKQMTSPKTGSKLPTTRIELKTDRSIDKKAAIRSSARKNPRESSRKGSERRNSVSLSN